ncbi:MAG: alpha/beta fold hydrolase [Planctomycetes bacterium]|nr:alpha/beta fold hydrolase [Planctomycetota bacterium]
MSDIRWIDAPANAHGRAARLAVRATGAGPLTVLLHGYPLDHRMWDAVRDGQLADHRTLAAIDLRGHGSSPSAGDDAHAMERFADDVAAVVDALAPDGRADVVGLSMGGYAALAFAERHPQRLRSLALVDTRAAADAPAARANREAAIAMATTQGASAIADAMLPKLLAPGADPAVAKALRAMIADTPVATIVADLRGLRDRADRTALLPAIAAPALVVVGEHDAITPVAEAEAMACALPCARLVVVPGAGHMTPMEQPAAFAEALAAFWRAIG